MTKIAYVSGSVYPSPTANSVQVVQQCNALSSAFGDVLLLARCAHGTSCSTSKVREDYGVYESVTLKLITVSSWLPVQMSALLYPFWVAWNISRRTPLLYGRHLPSLLIAALFRKPGAIVYECHSPPQRSSLFAFWLLCSLGRLTRIVVISEALKSIMRPRFPFTNDVEMIVAHDGCDPVSVLETDTTAFAVGYVGAFYRGRGLGLIAELARHFPDVVFHVVGGDNKAFSACTGLAIPANIICHGRIPPVQLDSFYSRFSIALAPYERSVEVADGTDTVAYMSPLKIFEYMGWGKAIIASDLPVLREVLDNGVNALLVEPEDVGSWVTGLLRLRNPNLRKSLAISAREAAILKYSWRARAMHVLHDIQAMH